jgi:lipopolysaccharide transport system ATP-binding protein
MAMCSRALWLSKGCTQLLADSKRVCEAYLGDLYNLEVNVKQASPKSKADALTAHKENLVDCRREWINSTILRNDLELQPFDISGTQFGDGLAQIKEVSLRNEEGNPMAWCVGGECVRLRVKALALADLKSVIVGFLIKDKLGQHLFGDNTFLRYADQPCNVSSQDTIASEFAFRMPVLPAGEYTLGVAVASGTQLKHEIHHWLHDALVIKSHSSSVSTGLIGIPMHQIFLAREATESSEFY